MSRSAASLFFVALVVAGIVVGFLGRPNTAVPDGPPDAFVFFDEEAEAEYYNDVATRENVNHAVVIGLLTIGVVGLIVVLGGRLGETDTEVRP